MSNPIDELPRVKVVTAETPADHEIYINGVRWSQWCNKVKVEMNTDALAHVTIGFYAHIVDDVGEVDVSV